MMKTVLAIACGVALAGVVSAGTNAKGLAYLEENGKKEGVITLASGMQYKVLRKGAGPNHPTKDSPCECHYEGAHTDYSASIEFH
jgi:FKBP-type peptidyl-prolyl cis-trans isomerase